MFILLYLRKGGLEMYTEAMRICIEECMELAEKPKQSSPWFEEYRKNHNISSTGALDRAIFYRMYSREPNSHEIQKIRFWRLQQHMPSRREEGIRLGQALDLTGEALDRFVMEALVSQKVSPVKDRSRIMNALLYQYLCRILPERLELLNIRPGTQKKQVRHIFYTDILDCLSVEKKQREYCYKEHLYSKNFAAEFQRYFEDTTIISRENMIRILLIFLMPDVDADVMNDWLQYLGYAPLNPENPVTGYVDHAVISMLRLCTQNKTPDLYKEKEKIKQILRGYDQIAKSYLGKNGEKYDRNSRFREKCLNRLRFMKVRSIDRILYSGSI